MSKLFEDTHKQAITYLLKTSSYQGENGIAYDVRFFSVIDGWIVCNQTFKARSRRIK